MTEIFDASRLRAAGWMIATLAGLVCLAAPARAEVWKCKAADGSTVFSDRPCPGQGRALDERQLRGNAIDGPRLPQTSRTPSEIPVAAEPAPSAPPNDCPGDQELRHMETRASSTTLGDQELAFLRDEIRRARQCRKGQGRYTAADWAISREAQAAQSNLKGAAEARLRAEGMHSAADPQEGERIAQQRRAQERIGQRLRNEQDRAFGPRPLPCHRLPAGQAGSCR